MYRVSPCLKRKSASPVRNILKYGPSTSVVTFYSRPQFCDGLIFSLMQMQPNIPLRISRSVQRNYAIVNDLTHCDTKLHLKEIHHSTYCRCEGTLPKDSVQKLRKGNLKGSYKKSLIPIQFLKNSNEGTYKLHIFFSTGCLIFNP